MIIPKNGRVVILDDKKEQAFPLINILSKNKIPFTYHSDDIELLPDVDQQYDDIRLLFLDVNLSADGTPKETIKSQLQSTLQRIIKPGTPYIAAIWSLKENEYEDLLNDLFQNRIPEIQPLLRISLTKNDFFDLVKFDEGKENERYEYVECDVIMDKLNSKIFESLNQLDALEPLIKWENIIQNSISSVISDIIEISKKDLNNNLKKIYYKLAQAYWGKQLKSKSDSEITQKALQSLNNILIDKIESDLRNKGDFALINCVNYPVEFDINFTAILNCKLLLSIDNSTEIVPGNLYQIDNDDVKKKIIEDAVDRSRFIKDYSHENGFNHEDVIDKEGKIIEKHKKSFQKFSFRQIPKLIERVKYIEIELTPICDFSQNNWVQNRILPGVLICENDVKYLKSNTDYFYLSPSIMYDDIIVRIMLDFRFLKAEPFEKFKGVQSIFRLKHLIFSDIQSQLSRHINRPGVVYVN